EVDRRRRHARRTAERGARGFHAHRGGVLVVGCHRPRTLAPPAGEGVTDGLPVEAEIGKVRAVSDDAGHGIALNLAYRTGGCACWPTADTCAARAGWRDRGRR